MSTSKAVVPAALIHANAIFSNSTSRDEVTQIQNPGYVFVQGVVSGPVDLREQYIKGTVMFDGLNDRDATLVGARRHFLPLMKASDSSVVGAHSLFSAIFIYSMPLELLKNRNMIISGKILVAIGNGRTAAEFFAGKNITVNLPAFNENPSLP